ncbi:MAG: amino acid ABC transporter ATP-binding protein [Gammaproteobacteria bacterium]|nr:amino acid ABC transporter ATP-binding protein [Gammaproteobacteria bacterium]
MVAAVEITNVSKSYADVKVLVNASLTVDEGATFGLIGPSGAGKSTLLRCINHLEAIDSGMIKVNGEMVGYRREGNRLFELGHGETARRRANIGMVFQHFNLFPHMTAIENVMAGPMYVKGMGKAEARAIAVEQLKTVGLENRADFYPSELSGGQQQRVGIARALAMEPSVLLLDEPTSALDPALVGEVLETMSELSTRGITMIVVTHEIGFARNSCNKAAIMVDGSILEYGLPEDVLGNPKEERSREFLRRIL